MASIRDVLGPHVKPLLLYSALDMFDDDTVFRFADDAVATTLDGEAVILDITSGTYFGLEGVGAFVCEQLQQPVTFGRLVSGVLERYEVERVRCSNDLRTLMTDLQCAGLVTTEGPAAE